MIAGSITLSSSNHIVQIDLARFPSELDIVLGSDAWINDGGVHVSLAGEVMAGIFEMHHHPTDRSQDRLCWSFAEPWLRRPTDFEVNPGSGRTTVKLRRYIDNERDAATSVFGGPTEFASGNERASQWFSLPNLVDSEVGDLVEELGSLFEAVAQTPRYKSMRRVDKSHPRSR